MESDHGKLRINPNSTPEPFSPDDAEEQGEPLLPFTPHRGLLPPPPSILVPPPEAIIIVNPEAHDSIKSGNFGKLVRRASQKYQQGLSSHSVVFNLYEKKPVTADSSIERSEDWHKFNF